MLFNVRSKSDMSMQLNVPHGSKKNFKMWGMGRKGLGIEIEGRGNGRT